MGQRVAAVCPEREEIGKQRLRRGCQLDDVDHRQNGEGRQQHPEHPPAFLAVGRPSPRLHRRLPNDATDRWDAALPPRPRLRGRRLVGFPLSRRRVAPKGCGKFRCLPRPAPRPRSGWPRRRCRAGRSRRGGCGGLVGEFAADIVAGLFHLGAHPLQHGAHLVGHVPRQGGRLGGAGGGGGFGRRRRGGGVGRRGGSVAPYVALAGQGGDHQRAVHPGIAADRACQQPMPGLMLERGAVLEPAVESVPVGAPQVIVNHARL